MKNHLKYSLILALCLIIGPTYAQNPKDVAVIKQAMQEQQEAWNAGDIPKFMEHYWKSDNLQFIGGNGPTYGWQETLDNYRKRYPNPTAMGKLEFTIIKIDQRSKKVYSLLGKFHLTRTIGDLEGHFLLIWKKIKGKWVIQADCTAPAG